MNIDTLKHYGDNIYKLLLTFKLSKYTYHFMFENIGVIFKNENHVELAPAIKNELIINHLNNNICLDNIEFLNHHIHRFNFNQFIESKQNDTTFILSSFYGTELFNIMSSYLCK